MKSRILLLLLILLGRGLCAQDLPNADSVGVKVYFRQGRSALELSFRNNDERLDEFTRKIVALRQDTMCQIQRIRITTGFSPEGGEAVNGKLSYERASRMCVFLQQRAGLSDSLFDVRAGGTDWAALSLLVATSEMPDRAAVLGILQNTTLPAARGGDGELKRTLTQLNAGRAWRYMEREFFPELRYAQVSVCYSRRRIQDLMEWKSARESLTAARTAMEKTRVAMTDLSLIIRHAELPDEVRGILDEALSMLQDSAENPDATREMEALLAKLETVEAPAEIVALLQSAARALYEADASLTKSREALASAEMSLKKAKELADANPEGVSVQTRTTILLLDNAVFTTSEAIEDAKRLLDRAKAELIVPRATPAVVEAPVSAPDVSNPFRMAVKSNLLYDAALVPNIGAEFYIGKGWSLGGSWAYAWWKNDRRHRYWRVYGGEVDVRKYFGRRAAASPLTGHHLGLYVQMLTYDFELGGTGYQSKFSYGAGLEYGYSLPIGRRLNLDFGIGIGYLGGEYKKYDPVDTHYVWKQTVQRHWFGPTKAEISLVWLFGGGNDNKNKKGVR